QLAIRTFQYHQRIQTSWFGIQLEISLRGTLSGQMRLELSAAFHHGVRSSIRIPLSGIMSLNFLELLMIFFREFARVWMELLAKEFRLQLKNLWQSMKI